MYLPNWLKILRNDIGHVSYLNQNQIDALRVQLGIQSAMTQNSILYQHRQFDLWDFEFQVFSQWGEDGILNHLCNVLDLFKPVVVEIGAGNFTECNSRFLAHYRNSSLYLIDASPSINQTFLNLDIQWKTSSKLESIFVTAKNVNEILFRARKSLGEIDILSIDIDGNDYWVLREIEEFDFSVVVLEYNSIFGSEKAVTIPYQDFFARGDAHFTHLYYGASLKAYINLLNSRGYKFVGTNRPGTNAFFVQEKMASKFTHLRLRSMSTYTSSNVRESRSLNGELSYLSASEGLDQIRNCALMDLDGESVSTISQVYFE